MNELSKSMLAKYDCKSIADYENALKEIIQSIALLGLWRGKFFEKAAFYGGTALRMMYNLPRFSEDLDFSLLKKYKNFDLSSYLSFVTDELEAYGFKTSVEVKKKNKQTKIDSAFIKANTLHHLLTIDAGLRTHKDALLKVKLEVDIDPVTNFETEAKQVFSPIPYSVRTLQLPDLFSGKLHALICRNRVNNIKGRDWYDLLWFISQGGIFRLNYLNNKLIQTGHWQKSKTLKVENVRALLKERILALDINLTKKDVRPFIKNTQDLDAWSEELFIAAADKLSGI